MPSVQSIPDDVVVSYYLAAQADHHLSTPDGMTLKLLHQLYSAGNAMARFHAEHCSRYQAWQFSSSGVSWHTFGWLYHHVFQRSGAVADRVYNYMKRHINEFSSIEDICRRGC